MQGCHAVETVLEGVRLGCMPRIYAKIPLRREHSLARIGA